MAIKGLKQSSETIVIGFKVDESAANTVIPRMMSAEWNEATQ